MVLRTFRRFAILRTFIVLVRGELVGPITSVYGLFARSLFESRLLCSGAPRDRYRCSALSAGRGTRTEPRVPLRVACAVQLFVPCPLGRTAPNSCIGEAPWTGSSILSVLSSSLWRFCRWSEST